MLYKTIKVFDARSSPPEIWKEICKYVGNYWPTFYWIVDFDPDSIVSKWLVEHGAEPTETVLLDLR